MGHLGTGWTALMAFALLSASCATGEVRIVDPVAAPGTTSTSTAATEHRSGTAAPEEVGEPTGPETTPVEACLTRLPIEEAVSRIPFVLLTHDSDASTVVGRVGGIGLIGSYRAGDVAALRTLLDTEDVPPLLSSDEEGGGVQRLRAALGPVPSAADVAAMPLDEAGAVYAGYAAGMADSGLDLNFAPVLAVGTGALGNRSYGSDPDVVIERAGLFMDAMRAAGVLPVVKHFPGLGSASANTDVGVATGPDLDRLRRVDLAPYRALLDGRPAGVMMSHVLVPDLSGDIPVSLSPDAYGLLRDDIGFDGLVVTDSLSAEAITATWTVPEAAVLAVAAGADMVLFKVRSLVDDVLDALMTAVEDGTLSEARVRDAAGSVLATQDIDPCRLVDG